MEAKVKNALKFFKMNESAISTLMGGVVVVLIASLIFNYFRSVNLKSWKGMLLDQQEASTTTVNDDKKAEEAKVGGKYKVVKGDDLWHISERYYKSGYNYVDIIKENKLAQSGLIYAGMELTIPNVAPKKLTVVEAKADVKTVVKTDTAGIKTETKTKSIDGGEYTTVKGDSLWTIAVRTYGDGFAWTKIYWANYKVIGKHPDMLYSGLKLTLPSLKK